MLPGAQVGIFQDDVILVTIGVRPIVLQQAICLPARLASLDVPVDFMFESSLAIGARESLEYVYMVALSLVSHFMLHSSDYVVHTAAVRSK